MPIDKSLELQAFFPPAAGTTVNTGTLDLGVDTGGFSDQWRLGRLKVQIPALPGNTNANAPVTVTLQDSADGGATFQTTNPLIQISVPGVANTGSAATNIDMPLYPGLRGPIQLQLSNPAGGGNLAGASALICDWFNDE